MLDRYVWNWNRNSFSNETLMFFFGKFQVSCILDLAKTVCTLRILSFEHRRTMYWLICYFAPVIPQRYIKYTLVHTFVGTYLKHFSVSFLYLSFLDICLETLAKRWLYISKESMNLQHLKHILGAPANDKWF